MEVWAEEMCHNNAWLAGLGGDPQEHQHPAGRHRISGSARLGLRPQIPRRPDLWLFLTWKLFERLVKERPIPVLYETPARS